jgi:ABC-type multidrug transport system ATPase subunit
LGEGWKNGEGIPLAIMLEICLSQFRLRHRILAESFSFFVPPHKVHALTGPNGCGKTLLFDAMSGIGEAEGASCRLDTLRLDYHKPWRRWRLGIRRLFQHPVLPPSLTVDHVLDETGARAHSHATELLNKTGITTAARMAQLSFGQVRIVELCITAGASGAILLDEPFAGLSPGYRPAVTHFIQRCAESGPSVLCIDHLHASSESLYHEVHRWPEPAIDLHLSSRPVSNRKAFPKELIEHEGISRSAVSWSVTYIGVNSRIIARDFSLKLEPGAIAVIIGSNGSGKSTLVRALSAMPQPSPVFESSLRSAPNSHDLIFSPQPPKLVPELTIRDNLALMINRSFRLDSALVSKINNLLKWLHGDNLPITTLAGNISGGEASLCALVGAVLSHRRIVILDEAMEGLATDTRERASTLLKYAAHRGQSFVMTTHITTSSALKGFHTLNLDTDTPLSGTLHLKAV